MAHGQIHSPMMETIATTTFKYAPNGEYQGSMVSTLSSTNEREEFHVETLAMVALITTMMAPTVL